MLRPMCWRDAVVIKFYRPGRWNDAQILEEHAFAAELRRQKCRSLRPGAWTAVPCTGTRFPVRRIPVLAWFRPGAGRTGAPGAAGPCAGTHACDGRARPIRDTGAVTDWAYGARARARSGARTCCRSHWTIEYEEVSGNLVQRVRVAGRRAGSAHLRLHGDCHLGNVLWNEQGPVFVDLDDCLAGPAVQDLWMLCSGSAAQQQREWRNCSRATSSLRNSIFGELALVEPLRAVRMLNHAAWLAARWADPAFPRAFPWFGGAAILGAAHRRAAGTARGGGRSATASNRTGLKGR